MFPMGYGEGFSQGVARRRGILGLGAGAGRCGRLARRDDPVEVLLLQLAVAEPDGEAVQELEPHPLVQSLMNVVGFGELDQAELAAPSGLKEGAEVTVLVLRHVPTDLGLAVGPGVPGGPGQAARGAARDVEPRGAGRGGPCGGIQRQGCGPSGIALHIAWLNDPISGAVTRICFAV